MHRCDIRINSRVTSAGMCMAIVDRATARAIHTRTSQSRRVFYQTKAVRLDRDALRLGHYRSSAGGTQDENFSRRFENFPSTFHHRTRQLLVSRDDEYHPRRIIQQY